ncbi:rap1 GTPase-activating protein 2-like isoform X2 [Branchiostoma lanceolatum]|uniref:rap1 GTPase-activating protein 2-like isoform X2 n=1 Tax=Branchiostoma lanceolatum TaxID=7740 RepID=UPI0034540B40
MAMKEASPPPLGATALESSTDTDGEDDSSPAQHSCSLTASNPGKRWGRRRQSYTEQKRKKQQQQQHDKHKCMEGDIALFRGMKKRCMKRRSVPKRSPQVRRCREACTCPVHNIQPCGGYWIECSGRETTSPEERLDKESCAHDTEQKSLYEKIVFHLEPTEEEQYRQHLYGKQHWIYCASDAEIGPVVLALRQEQGHERESIRVQVRTSAQSLVGLVPFTALCADRYDADRVSAALGEEMGVSGLHSVTHPLAPEQLVRLDDELEKTDFKVGVLYVKEGQTTEEEILANTCSSELFNKFLANLGERVNLKGFDGYCGGLDRSGDLTGETSVYTEWRGLRLMFHVCTLLPHDPADSQQVSVVSRDEVLPYGPPITERHIFSNDSTFREWLLTKIVNGERACYSSPKLASMRERTRRHLLDEMVKDFSEQNEIMKQGNPLFGNRKRCTLLPDSLHQDVRQVDELSADFATAFSGNMAGVCDVTFIVGRERARVRGVRAILVLRNRVFRDMLLAQSDKKERAGTSSSSPRSPTARRPSLSAPASPASKSKNPLHRVLNLTKSDHDSSSKKLDRKSPTNFSWPRTPQLPKTVKALAELGRAASTSTIPSKPAVPPSDEYPIPDFDPAVFSTLLRYLHTGTCTISPDVLPGLAAASDRFEVKDLRKACLRYTSKHLTTENVWPMLHNVQRYMTHKTTRHVFEEALHHVVDKNMPQILRRSEFVSLPDDVKFTIVERIGRSYSKQSGDTVSSEGRVKSAPLRLDDLEWKL